MRSLSSRGWILAGAVAGLVVLALAWVVVISPVRSDASQLRDDTTSVQMQNTVVEAQNNKLGDEAKHTTQLTAELQAALGGLPSGAGLPVFSRQLATQAAAEGLTLTSVSVGTPVATTTAVAPTVTAADAAASADGIATTPAPVATTTTGPQAVPVTVQTTGPALQQLRFLRAVQTTGPRLALINSTSLAPGQGATDTGSIDANATMTVQLTVFTNPLPKTTREQLAKLTRSAASS